MKIYAKWIGGEYPRPQTWLFKKDMPPHLHCESRRIDFGIHGLAYVAVNLEDSVLLRDGRRLPIYRMYLRTPGWVIGPRDTQVAANFPWAFEWQTACADRRFGEAA